MSAFDFPASPTINDLYSANNVTYICTGTSPSIWKKLGSDVSTGVTKVAVLQDIRSLGTNGGTATAANWHGRRLNSKIDPQNFVTIVNGTTGINGTANTFRLEAGTYLLQWRAPGYDSGNMRAKMAYTTDANYNTLFNSQSSAGVSYLSGESAQSEPTNESNVYATGSATITISQTTYFRLQHYVTNNNANNDNALGEAGSITGENEIYSQVIVQDLSTAVKLGGAGSAIELLTEKTATGETSVEFTGIPSDAMEITLFFKGVSASGTNNYKIQLGTANGYITSGYESISQSEGGGAEVTETDSFVIGSSAGGHVRTGSMLIKKASDTSYVQTGQFAVSPPTPPGGNQTYGSLSSVSGTVDRLKIILSGSNTFDAGTMNVSYKTTGGGSTSGHTRVAIVKDQKNYNVDGGTFVQGGWRDRDLTVKDDPFGFVTLYPTSNGETTPSPGNDPGYFSLPAGKYKIKFRAPAFKVDSHMAAMLWSSTESNISKTYANSDARDGESFGSSEISQDDNGRVSNHSVGVFVVEITQTSYFKLIHYGKDTQSSNGFGESANTTSPDPETYTIIEIEDLATATKLGAGGDKIEEGDTSAEVIDTGSDGHFIVKAEGKEKFRVNGATNNVFIGAHTSDNPFTYLRFAGSQYGAADIRPMDELSHKVGLSFYVDNTQDSTINPVERMHLTHNGILNLGRAVGGSSFDPVNATGDVAAGMKLMGATTSSTPGDGFAMLVNAKTIVGIFNRTNTTGRILEFKYNASVVGSIETNGTNTSYIESSDYRLKENIVGISDGITRLKTLKPYRFNFKSYPEKTVDGFLAHEVTAVPEAISGTKDQVDSDNNPVYQGIDKSKLVPLLVAALQEAVAKIEILETKVAALEG